MLIQRSILAVLLTLFLAGCTSVQVKPVVDKSTQEGFRYYRPQPYLWVSLDCNQKLQSLIIWLPNTKEEYAISMRSGLGSSKMTFKLADGWNLVDFNEEHDTKIPETLTALPGVIGSIQGLKRATKSGNDSKPPELKPGLYAFVFDQKTGVITGLKPININGN